MADLLPCPFCGSSVEPCSKIEDGVRYYWLHCECGASASGFRALSVEELAKTWNRRAPAVDRDAVLEEAARLCETHQNNSPGYLATMIRSLKTGGGK